MSKYKMITGILLAAVLISGEAYCQQGIKNQRVMTISGNIATSDVESGVLNVKTDNGMMVFYLSTESALFRSTHHMSAIEIGQDDPVIIQYISSSGQNNVINLVDNKPGT